MIQRTWWPRLNPNAQLAKGLVFAGLGGGASTLRYADASIYGNDATLVNTAPATDWQLDPQLNRWTHDFNGSNAYAALGAPSLRMFLGARSITFSCWVKTSQTARASLFGAYESSSNPFYEFEINRGATFEGAGKIWAGARKTSNGYDLIAYTSSDTSVNDGAWHHIACVLRLVANTVSIYLDGVSQGVTYVTQAYGAPGVATNTYPQWIGGQNNAGSLGVPYDGLLADMLAHARELPPGEIQQLADPSNTLLSGLILPPRRVVFPAAVAGGYKTVSISSPLDVTVTLEGFPIAVNRTIQITG
jgi:hypothetical protein